MRSRISLGAAKGKVVAGFRKVKGGIGMISPGARREVREARTIQRQLDKYWDVQEFSIPEEAQKSIRERIKNLEASPGAIAKNKMLLNRILKISSEGLERKPKKETSPGIALEIACKEIDAINDALWITQLRKGVIGQKEAKVVIAYATKTSAGFLRRADSQAYSLRVKRTHELISYLTGVPLEYVKAWGRHLKI